MKRFRLHAAAIAGLLLTLGVVSYAVAGDGGKKFKGSLTGFQEVPAISSTGTGSFELRIAKDEQSFDWTLSYANLEGTITNAAHIHLGQPGVNGGVSVNFCGVAPTPPCTPGSGTFSGTATAADVVGPAVQGIAPGEFAELVRAIRAGVTYANVHTNKHPGGEIRARVGHGNGDDDDS